MSRLPLLSFCRFVRSRRNAQPVQWLEDATTYSDTHNLLTDPVSKLPYPQQDLEERMERTARDALKEHRKLKYGRKKTKPGISFDHLPIEDHVVLLFPGQGSQFAGMGKVLSNSKPAMELFERASSILQYDLFDLCTKGPKTKLDQTLYCQPAVMVSSLAAFEKLKEDEPDLANNCTDAAGFSVGEFSALVAGNILSFDDAVRIVSARARAMHECSQLIRSGMVTVRVNAASRLDEAMAAARQVARDKGEMDVCQVANLLYCGVKVVGASETCTKFLEENANTYKIQVVKRLAVAGAFHTSQMEGAVEKVKAAVKSAELHTAIMNVYSNYTGQIYPTKKAEIRAAIAKQVTSPVKWEQIQQLLYRKHQDYKFPRFLEVGPGRQLGAMLMQTSKKAFATYKHIPC